MSKPLLSIGMIVKNESKHLRNCLTALSNIRKKIDSELIIADTGSTDDTVQIAKEFTDNVMEIPWNDSFADARNHTLFAANGTWFMFIDADEYLEDDRDIVNFFKNGLYEKFSVASYKVRNYRNDTDFDSSVAVRLYKIFPDSKFIGHVHEYIITNLDTGLNLILDSYVRHYGYINTEDPELSSRKMMRNLPLTIRSYEEDPTDLNTLSCLARSYISLGEWDKVETYTEEALDIVGDGHSSIFFCVFWRYKIIYETYEADEDANRTAIALVEEFFNLRPNPSVSHMEMWYIKANSLYNLGEYEDALAAYGRTFRLLQRFIEGKLDVRELSALVTEWFNESGLRKLTYDMARCCVQLNDFDKAFARMERIPLVSAETVDYYYDIIFMSKQTNRLGGMFDKIAALPPEDKDRLLKHFDSLVLRNKNAISLITPFFDIYTAEIYAYLSRAGDLTDKDKIESLPTHHQAFYHIRRAEGFKKKGDKPSMMKHFQAAIRIDRRFAQVVSRKMQVR